MAASGSAQTLTSDDSEKENNGDDDVEKIKVKDILFFFIIWVDILIFVKFQSWES